MDRRSFIAAAAVAPLAISWSFRYTITAREIAG